MGRRKERGEWDKSLSELPPISSCHSARDLPCNTSYLSMSQELKQASFIKPYNPCSLQEIPNLLQEFKILQDDTSTPKQQPKCLSLFQESTQVVITPRPRSGLTSLLARRLVIPLMPLFVHPTVRVVYTNTI